jgi:hypothetical protein
MDAKKDKETMAYLTHDSAINLNRRFTDPLDYSAHKTTISPQNKWNKQGCKKEKPR